MHRNIFIIITFCFGLFTLTVNGQTVRMVAKKKAHTPKEVIIYSEGDGYLQPFITDVLKKMEYKEKGKTTPYFNKVNSLNTFIKDNQYQVVLSELITLRKPVEVNLDLSYSMEESADNLRIFKILTNYDYFLAVNTNTLNELIEFQFQLYETRKIADQKDRASYRQNISDKVLGVENFFINPRKSGYRMEVRQALERLFNQSNSPPNVHLKILDRPISNKDDIILPTKTEIVFDGSLSGDIDSQTIKYNWKNIPFNGQQFQTNYTIPFTRNEPVQKITLDREGFYQVSFSVDDGVSKSEEIVFTIEAIHRPGRWIPQDSIYYSIHDRNIFGGLYRKPEQPLKIDLANYAIEYEAEHLKKRFLITHDKIPISYLGTDQLPSDTLTITPFATNKRFADIIAMVPYSANNYGVFLKNNTYYSYRLVPSYYVYWYDEQTKFFSQPSKVIHQLETKQLFKYHVMFSFYTLNNTIDSFDLDDNEENVSGMIISVPEVGLSVKLLKRLELGVSIPVTSSRKGVHKDVLIRVNPLYNLFARYNLNNSSKTTYYDKNTREILHTMNINDAVFGWFFGARASNFPYSNKTSMVNGNAWMLSGEMGMYLFLFKKRKIDVEFSPLAFSYGTFISKKLDGVNGINYSSSINIRF